MVILSNSVIYFPLICVMFSWPKNYSLSPRAKALRKYDDYGSNFWSLAEGTWYEQWSNFHTVVLYSNVLFVFSRWNSVFVDLYGLSVCDVGWNSVFLWSYGWRWLAIDCCCLATVWEELPSVLTRCRTSSPVLKVPTKNRGQFTPTGFQSETQTFQNLTLHR